MRTPEQHLEAHGSAGRMFEAAGIASFVREEGDGAPVVCLHGVPASSFLYRKMLHELSERRLRGIAFDFPGLGFADRPAGFDYTFTGLGEWTAAAVDALGLQRFHLVIHDIGGPIGFELVAAQPERVLSLTILNTILVGIDGFRKPWVMRPFESPILGPLYLATLNRFMFTRLMYLQGVQDRTQCSPEEAAVYVDLLKRSDGGSAFLKIMRSFETTRAKEDLYVNAVEALDAPVQFIWGEFDSALTVERYGKPAHRAIAASTFHTVRGKHFIREDHAPEISALVAVPAGL